MNNQEKIMKFLDTLKKVKPSVKSSAQLSAVIAHNIGSTCGIDSGSMLLSVALADILDTLGRNKDLVRIPLQLKETKNNLQVFSMLCAETAEVIWSMSLQEEKVEEGFAE